MPHAKHSARSRYQRTLLAALLTVGLSGIAACYKEASDLDQHVRETSTSPWSVNGVIPGMPYEDCRRILGEPSKSYSDRGAMVYAWEKPELTLSVDGAGRVTEISGTSLSINGKVIIWPGLSVDEVSRILGEGSIQHSSTTSSGIMGFVSRVKNSETISYGNHGATFELSNSDVGIRSIRARIQSAPTPKTERKPENR